MYTGSRYEENVAFHVVIWMKNIIDNNILIMETTTYNFWLQADKSEWRCLKRVSRETNLITFANLARLD